MFINFCFFRCKDILEGRIDKVDMILFSSFSSLNARGFVFYLISSFIKMEKGQSLLIIRID